MSTFLARQPIFDQKFKVIAYELLFRESAENIFSAADSVEATHRLMMDSFLNFEVERLTDGKKAFINLTREILLTESVFLLPSKFYCVEITEDIPADSAVLDACRKLKEKGYTIILDGFEFEEQRLPLLDFADLVKIDIMKMDRQRQDDVLKHYCRDNLSFLAAKVETPEDLEVCKDIGFDYFQGFFFSKPVIVSQKKVPGIKVQYLQMLSEINQKEISLDEVDAIIKRDVSLAYKLLRHINSSFFGMRNEITSIQHALVVLGEDEIRKWACLIAMGKMGTDKPEELVTSTLIRARFCESLAPSLHMQNKAQDLFLMGIFSNVHVIVGRPLEEILASLPIAKEVRDALLNVEGQFRDILGIVTAYEKGKWKDFATISRRHKLEEDQIPTLYLDAVEWATSCMKIN